MRCAASGFDFHENNQISIGANKIQFQVAMAPVSGKDGVALANHEAGGAVFSGMPQAQMRGLAAVGLVIHGNAPRRVIMLFMLVHRRRQAI